jgi:hypothetical protein
MKKEIGKKESKGFSEDELKLINQLIGSVDEAMGVGMWENLQY